MPNQKHWNSLGALCHFGDETQMMQPSSKQASLLLTVAFDHWRAQGAKPVKAFQKVRFCLTLITEAASPTSTETLLVSKSNTNTSLCRTGPTQPHFIRLGFPRLFKLLFLMSWVLWISQVTYEDLKTKPRLLHDMGIFLTWDLHIFRNVNPNSLADVVMCTFCKNTEQNKISRAAL